MLNSICSSTGSEFDRDLNNSDEKHIAAAVFGNFYKNKNLSSRKEFWFMRHKNSILDILLLRYLTLKYLIALLWLTIAFSCFIIFLVLDIILSNPAEIMYLNIIRIMTVIFESVNVVVILRILCHPSAVMSLLSCYIIVITWIFFSLQIVLKLMTEPSNDDTRAPFISLVTVSMIFQTYSVLFLYRYYEFAMYNYIDPDPTRDTVRTRDSAASNIGVEEFGTKSAMHDSCVSVDL